MTRLDAGSELACSLNDHDFRERRAMARRTLIPNIDRLESGPGTLKLTFHRSQGLLKAVEEFVELERQCCGFLDFQIEQGCGSQPHILVISGPDEASQTLAMFAEAVRNGSGGPGE